MMDVDQDWQVLSRLASPTKRSETCRHAAATAGERDAEQVRRVAARLGCQPSAPGKDPLLDAIEGRGEGRDRDPALNFGLGGARVFPPEAVRRIAVTFSQFPLSDEFLLPPFVRLSEFYQHAAQVGHYVVVLHL